MKKSIFVMLFIVLSLFLLAAPNEKAVKKVSNEITFVDKIDTIYFSDGEDPVSSIKGKLNKWALTLDPKAKILEKSGEVHLLLPSPEKVVEYESAVDKKTSLGMLKLQLQGEHAVVKRKYSEMITKLAKGEGFKNLKVYDRVSFSLKEINAINLGSSLSFHIATVKVNLGSESSLEMPIITRYENGCLSKIHHAIFLRSKAGGNLQLINADSVDKQLLNTFAYQYLSLLGRKMSIMSVDIPHNVREKISISQKIPAGFKKQKQAGLFPKFEEFKISRENFKLMHDALAESQLRSWRLHSLETVGKSSDLYMERALAHAKQGSGVDKLKMTDSWKEFKERVKEAIKEK